MTAEHKLVIVESPTKARKIGGYLGSDYTVMASVGHIRDLAQPSQVPAGKKEAFGKFGVDVEHGFAPYYVVGADKKKTVSELKSSLARANELYLATDEDREGEAIAWHLVEALKPKVPVKRMVFHEITKDAIQASLLNTRDVDNHMVDAQETRRILDRLYGYELSPVLWRKVGPGLSAGRVQSVATRLIVERERERMAFKQAEYWDVVAKLNALDTDGNNVDFQARLTALNNERIASSKDFNEQGVLVQRSRDTDHDNAADHESFATVRHLDEATASALVASLQNSDFVVETIEKKPYRRRPMPPFTTSTLQQAAGNRLSMSSRQTMRTAQALYENGYITYMRTDSVTLSSEALHAARVAVEHDFGTQYLADKPKQYATTSAGAQEAHECIRPAGSHFKHPSELASVLSAEQLKLYTLIWQRTIASQMADATGFTASMKFVANAAQYGQATFQAAGTVIEFAGFLKVFGSNASNTVSSTKTSGDSTVGDTSRALPVVHVGDVLEANEVQSEKHETLPPARYTEASLVKTLEAKEIGRPSTYASIISTIIDRGYVYERGRALIPSWLAFAVIKLLEANFPTYVDYAFTADMEHGLDRIAKGDETGKSWLTRFYFGDDQQTHVGLQRQVEQLGDIDAREINTIEIADGLHVRVGRYGPYLEDVKTLDDSGNPRHASIPDHLTPDELTAEVAYELLANNADGPRVLGVDPQTGGTVEVRNGRFGPYIALVMASQAGDDAAQSQQKPKMASLFKTMDPMSVSLDDALALLHLPRVVGHTQEADENGTMLDVTIEANNGRYGPYLTKTYEQKIQGKKPETRSLSSEEAIFSITLEEAIELFNEPKYAKRSRGAAKPPLRELGADPDNGKTVVIKDGFYGAYITDGETNRTLPKQYTPESITPEEAFELLAQKRAQGPVKRRKRTTTAKKKPTAKKATVKKTVAKK